MILLLSLLEIKNGLLGTEHDLGICVLMTNWLGVVNFVCQFQ